jgi:spermidine/putrescine transport system permease protein
MNGGTRSGGRTLLISVAIAVYIFLFGPLVVAILLAFSNAQFAMFPISGFSMQWFAALSENEVAIRSLLFSCLLGFSATCLALLFGIPAALVLARYKLPGRNLINLFVVSPILIPETILAVGLLLLMGWINEPRSFVVLLSGHVMLTVPYVVLIAQARLIGVKRVYEEAARSLGANGLQTFKEVTLPLMMPAVWSGGLLAFVISFDNITATMFWRPGGTETVPTMIYGMLRDSVSPEINALGAIMVAVTLGVPIVGGLLVRLMAHRSPRKAA